MPSTAHTPLCSSLRCSEHAAALRDGMPRLLAHLLSGRLASYWSSATYMVQLGDAVAVLAGGRVVSFADMAVNGGLLTHHLPHALSVSPLALVGGQPAWLQLTGAHLAAPDLAVVVKCGGRYVKAQAHGFGATSGAVCGSGGISSCCAAAGVAGTVFPEDGGPAASPAPGACPPDGAADNLAPPPLSLRARVTLPKGRCSVVWVEVSRGAFLCGARPLLVVDDAALAQDVCRLSALEGEVLSSDQVDALLLDLALVLGHMAAPLPADVRGSAAGLAGQLGHAAIATKARRLLAWAADQGWRAVAAAVLPLAEACGACAADVVAAVQGSSAADGLSLLHRAVRGGCPALVQGVLQWGEARGFAWPIASGGGPGGLTPLHLAAMLEDDGVVLLQLLDACSDGLAAFTATSAADGVTPFQLAFQMGHYSLDRLLDRLGGAMPGTTRRVLEQQCAPTGWQLLKAAADALPGGDPDCVGDGGAPAAVAGRRPLKERLTSCLDACLYCQSTLPPLLLSIKASCAGCGVRQPCVADDAADVQLKGCSSATAVVPGTPPAAAVAGSVLARSTPCHPSPSPPSPPSAAATAAALGCAHNGLGRVLSVTALCQTCHANRVLEVA